VALLLAGCFGGPEPQGDKFPWRTTTAPGTGDTTPGGTQAPATVRIALQEVASGLAQPLFLTALPGTGLLAVVEQPGRIRLIDGDQLLPEAFLDITAKVGAGGERGLLGLAFDPQEQGTLYVDYTDKVGDTVVERYSWSGRRADPQSGLPILRVRQPYSNHNGGMIAFGPDGMLRVGLGDGGSGGDPENRAQDTQDLLGKILRIDVRASGVGPDLKPRLYGIPPDNPFADGRGGAPEVWSYGLRNPWRFSFDRETGDLWIGDVGQGAWEEIDLEPAGTPGGRNHGWSAYEGTHRFDHSRAAPGHVPPVYEYSRRSPHCAVTGGYVYRGEAIPELRGAYLYSDYCSGHVWTLQQADGGWSAELALETGLRVSSFGEDAIGELYVIGHGGSVHRIVAAV
jgi:glucose/arabinose dehydrogenase